MSWESASYDIKTLREDRHGLEENFVAEATVGTAHNRESWDKIDRIYLTDWHSGAKLTMYFDMSF